MSEYGDYYSNCNTGYWQDSDPKECGCRGRGWFLSQVDTWHRCSYHGKDAPHPEDYHPDLLDEEYEGRVDAVMAELDREEKAAGLYFTEDDLPF